LIFATKVKSKGKELQNAGNVARKLINLVILQNYFRKLLFFGNKFIEKFYEHKNKCNVTNKFFCASRRTLPGVATGGERGGGLEVHMNLMPPGVTKISFFSIFWTFRAASC
jgi:hypothetical protein